MVAGGPDGGVTGGLDGGVTGGVIGGVTGGVTGGPVRTHMAQACRSEIIDCRVKSVVGRCNFGCMPSGSMLRQERLCCSLYALVHGLRSMGLRSAVSHTKGCTATARGPIPWRFSRASPAMKVSRSLLRSL